MISWTNCQFRISEIERQNGSDRTSETQSQIEKEKLEHSFHIANQSSTMQNPAVTGEAFEFTQDLKFRITKLS